MNKIKTLTILVGILAIINIGLLIFLLVGKTRGHGPKGPRDKEKAGMFIQKKFGFDESQMKSFRESKANHRSNVEELEGQLAELSRSFYTVESDDKQEVRDSLMKVINQVSESIYMSNVKHFDDVREICRPEQLPEMENFVKGLLNRKMKRKRR